MMDLTVSVNGKPIKSVVTGGEVDITADESEGWKRLAHFILETEPDIHDTLARGDEIDIGGVKCRVINAETSKIVVDLC